MENWRGFSLIVLSVLLLAACATSPEKEISEQELEALVRQQEQSDPFLRTQTDVGLSAYWSGPGVLQVRVKNKSPRTMEIRPDFFGLLYVERRSVDQALPGSRQTFPILNLQPDEEAAGVLKFEVPDSNMEVRLVFEHEDKTVAPAMAPIQNR